MSNDLKFRILLWVESDSYGTYGWIAQGLPVDIVAQGPTIYKAVNRWIRSAIGEMSLGEEFSNLMYTPPIPEVDPDMWERFSLAHKITLNNPIEHWSVKSDFFGVELDLRISE